MNDRAGAPGGCVVPRLSSESQWAPACVQDAAAECAAGAGHHSLGDGRAMFRTEVLSGLDNRGGSPGESLDERSVVSRSVIGTLGQSGGDRNWCHDDRADVRPELALVLHVPFPSSATCREGFVYLPR